MASHRSLIGKAPVHKPGDVGSSPAGATKCRDGVTGNTMVSKTVELSSNLSPFANHSAVGKWFKPLDFQSGDLRVQVPSALPIFLGWLPIGAGKGL